VLPAWEHRKAAELKRDVLWLLDGFIKRGAPLQANRLPGLGQPLSEAASNLIRAFNVTQRRGLCGH
jgi:hypothetical protein